MKVQLASVSRSSLILGLLLSSLFIVLAAWYLHLELAKDGRLTGKALANVMGGLATAAGLFAILFRIWWLIRDGLYLDSTGLVWAEVSLIRKKLVRVPWEDIKAVRVAVFCDGESGLYLLLRRGASNAAPLGQLRCATLVK